MFELPLILAFHYPPIHVLFSTFKLSHNPQNLRDALAKTKHARDTLKAANVSLKQEQGFIGSDRLAIDFEGRKHTLDELETRLAQLNERQTLLNQQVGSVLSVCGGCLMVCVPRELVSAMGGAIRVVQFVIA